MKAIKPQKHFMKISLITLVLLWIVSMGNLQAQSLDSLNLDPSIRYGKLKNGFTYYIKPLPKETAKTHMQLVVNAGIGQQDPDQYEIAHYVEHMPFVKTQHFSHTLHAPELLDGLNMESGDVNARTGWDQTLYWFNPPSHHEKALENGFLFFYDIIGGQLPFRQADIDGERAPFFGEYIYRGAKDTYSNKRYEHQLFLDCYTPPVPPDQYENYIQSFSKDKLIRFYKDWYRPDLAVLLISGNIKNVDDLEEKIRKRFSDIPKSKNPRSLKDCIPGYLAQPDQFINIQKQYASSGDLKDKTQIKLIYKDAYTENRSAYGLKRMLHKELYYNLLDERLRKALNTYNTPYNVYSIKNKNLPVTEVHISVENEFEKEGVQFTAGILKSLQQYGTKESEWSALKTNYLQTLNRAQVHQPEYWMYEMKNHFVRQEALPRDKHQLLNQILKGISLEEMNAYLKEHSTMPDDMVVITPKNTNTNFTEKQLRRWIRRANAVDTRLEKESTSLNNLLPTHPLETQGAKKYKIKAAAITGVTEVCLENGVQLILKPTDTLKEKSENNKISLHGFSKEGIRSFAPKDIPHATFAAEIVKNAGVKDMDKFELAALKKENIPSVNLYPYIDYAESGVKGEANLKELESLLQLLYLYFAEPRKDKIAFNDWLQKERNNYLNPPYGIEEVDFNYHIQQILEDNTPSLKGTSRIKAVKKVELERAYNVYETVFRNASNFTFILTGAFDQEQLLPLLNQYLGNLPDDFPDRTEKKTNKEMDNNVWDLAPLTQEFYPIQPIENVRLRWDYVSSYQGKYAWQDEIKLKVIGLSIAIHLQSIRYVNKRGVFFSTAGSVVNRTLKRNHTILNVPTSKEDVGLVLKDIDKIIENIKIGKGQQAVLEDVKRFYFNAKYDASNLRKAQPMLDRLYRHYRYDEPWVNADKIEAYVQSLTVNDLAKTAQKYLTKDNHFLFMLKNKPEVE